MSKNMLGIVIALVAVVLIGGVVYMSSKDDKPTTSQSSTNQSQTTPEESKTSQQPAGEATTPESNKVEIKDFAYAPNKITIKKGTTVTWTNQDSVKHDVTPDNESASFEGSELLAKGESYSFTFDTAGTYTYHCSPHPNMKATIEVTE